MNSNINKNKYGNNKLERMINKTKAYFDLDLVSMSNKYFKINNWENSELLFVINNEETCYLDTKFGRKLKIDNVNMEKPVWVNDYYTIEVVDRMGNLIGYIVKSNHEDLINQIEGYDYVYLLKDFIKNSKDTLVIRKP